MTWIRTLGVSTVAAICGSWALQEPAPKAAEPRAQVFAAIFERGPAWAADKPVLQQRSIPEHIQHNRSLGQSLLGAAPFSPLDDKDTTVGMVLFKAASLEEARALLDKDPVLVDKVMTAKLRRWHVDALAKY